MKTLALGTFLFVALAMLNRRPAGGSEPDGPAIRDRVRKLAEEFSPTVVQWRRDFHAHPELSNREERTARVVAQHLREMGIDDVKTGVAHHGVVALIPGGKPGPTVALRADMDALPIEEKAGLEYASKNKGVMHACGHDVHTAVLLGTAQVLMKIRDQLPGTVKLIFQPAEEGTPLGEDGGAGMMVDQGVLENPKVSAIFALHVSPELDTGKIAYRTGVFLASVDRFHVTVTGKQSHGAMPWQGVDPIVATAHVITAIQTVASRRIDARDPVVVSVGIIRAGQAWNIIPAEVVLEGTIRTHDTEVRRQATQEFHRIVQQTAAAHGATAKIDLSDYGPAVWNDPELGARMTPTVERAVGEGNLVESKPAMGGEDFAHYAQKVPGFFMFLGVHDPSSQTVHGLHTPYVVADESALPLGVRAMALLAVDYLTGETR